MIKESAKIKKTKPLKKKEEQEVLFEENSQIADVPEKVKEETIPDNDGKVGTLLKEARLKKGLNIPEISKDLCIRKSYLEAIEASNYKTLPEPPYGAGFVRSYADYLGLNSLRLVQLFKEELNVKPAVPGKVLIDDDQLEVPAPNKKYIIISLIAIAVVYVSWLAYNNAENIFVKEISPNTFEETNNSDNFPLIVEDFATIANQNNYENNLEIIDTTLATESVNPQVTITEESFYEPSAEEKNNSETTVPVPAEEVLADRVVLRVKKAAWVEIKDDEKLYLSKELKEGDVYVVPNEGKGIIYSVGRRDAVDVVIDGKVVDVLPADKKKNISLDKFLQH